MYGSAASISDTNVTSLNNVVLGFTSAQLSTLTFTTTTSIAALGALSDWSTSQVEILFFNLSLFLQLNIILMLKLSGLYTPLNNYITNTLSGTITADFMTSAGNLLCSLSSTHVTGVSTTVFASSISSLSKISLGCPNIANWYTLAKTVSAYGSSLYSSSSSISELGSVMSGISTTDIALVSTDAISSFSTTAFQYMPAATVNLMSSSQLSALAIDQVSALLNSPYYSSFSSAVTSALAVAAGGSGTTSAVSQISPGYLVKFLISFSFILLKI